MVIETATGTALPQPFERGALPFSTRLTPPRLAAETTLRRPHLLDALHAHVSKRATLVAAPAGFGKTTLLAQFAAEVDALTCWCSLDEADHDVRTLVSDLAASIARRVPGFGQRTLAALDGLAAAGEADEMLQGRTAAGLFVSELEEGVADYVVLILDDCQAVAGCAPASAVLDALLRRLPEHCHLVLAGRSLPDLPSLPGFVVRRHVARLDQTHLRFSVEETAEAVQQAGLSSLTPAQAEALHAQTLGWPIAVLLLAPHAAYLGDGLAERTAPEHDNARSARFALPHQARQALFAFLAAEVLEGQPRPLWSLLMSASVLQYADVDRCAALLGRPREEVRRLLAAAEARGLFLTRFEADKLPVSGGAPVPPGSRSAGAPELAGAGEGATGGRVAYRFHDLFREFLLDTLREQQPVRYRWLQRRASHLAERSGELSVAVGHALGGQHYARAARLVERAAPNAAAEGRWRTLRAWLAALPLPALDARPRLLLLAARAEHALGGDHERATTCLQRAESRLAHQPDAAAEIQLLRAAMLGHRGRYQEAATLCRAALERLDASSPAQLRAEACFRLAISVQRLGHLAVARDLFAEAARLFSSLDDAAHEGLACDGLGFINLRLGRLDAAAGNLEAARSIWRRLGNFPALSRTLNNLGLVQHYLGDYAAARDLLAAAAHAARAAAIPGIEACAQLSLGDLARDEDKLDSAAEAYQCGLRLAREAGSTYLTRYATDALGQMRRLTGDLAGAEALARQAVSEAQAAGSRYEEGLFLRSLALVYLARQEYGRAQTALDRALEALTASDAGREVARTRLYRAQLARAARRRKDAQRELAALVDLLADLGYYGFLLADARRARPVLEYGVGAGVGGQRLVSLLADALAPISTTATEAQAPPPLRASGSMEDQAGAALPALEAFALGQSEVRTNGQSIGEAQWQRTKSKELFFYLLCHPGWRRRAEIVAEMWPDASPAAGRSAFHTNAHRLRRVLHPDLLQQREGRYRLHPAARCWFDATEFEQRCRDACAEGSDRQTAPFTAALALYRGPFLQDLAPEWAQPLRERLEALYVAVAVRLGRSHADRCEYSAALTLAHQVLAVDPYLEPAHELAMVCYVLAGQPAAALHHYRRYATLLREDLAAEPSPDLAALHRHLLRSAAVRATFRAAAPSLPGAPIVPAGPPLKTPATTMDASLRI